ncbi:MAG: thioredoxin [Candidatus Dojkabacteria bacterium]
MALILTDDNFADEVENFEGTVLVDFWAEWCGPCKMLGPTIEEVAEEMEGKDDVKIAKLNVDENRQTAIKFQVMSIPTIIVFKDGKPAKSLIGVRPKQEYVTALGE